MNTSPDGTGALPISLQEMMMPSNLRPSAAVLPQIDRMDLGDHTVWHLPPRPESASVARHAIRPHLDRWGVINDAADAAELLVTELVTNAVLHGGPPVSLHLAHDSGRLWITVHHTGTPLRAPWPGHVPLTEENGCSFQLVSALANSFNITSGQRGVFAAACLLSQPRGLRQIG